MMAAVVAAGVAAVVAMAAGAAGAGGHGPASPGYTADDRLFDCRVDGDRVCGPDVVIRGACVTYPDGHELCRWGDSRQYVPFHAPTGGR